MRMVLTLIAGAGDRSSLAGLAEAVAEAARISAKPIWLAPNEACDLVFDAAGAAPVEQAARAVIGDAKVDIIVQPIQNRRKRLLVADMESTIIENEMLDELADLVGLRRQVSEITRRAMNGEIDFEGALKARVSLFAGMEEGMLDRAAVQIRLNPGAGRLIATMRASGALTALVSGGLMTFAELVAAELGFDRVIANRLDIAAGRIAGTLRPPIVTGTTKQQTLFALAAEHGIPLDQTIAVGDGANDLPMLTAAGIGIAFHPKPLVASGARWRVDYGNLTSLLYAQGYRKQEFVG